MNRDRIAFTVFIQTRASQIASQEQSMKVDWNHVSALTRFFQS
jgi:hypothetical protein